MSLLPAFNQAARLEVDQMGKHRPAGGGEEPRIERRIHRLRPSPESAAALAEQPQDLPLALHPVADQARARAAADSSPARRAPDNRSGRRAAQLVEARHISGHVAVGRETTVVDQPIT